MNTEQKDLILNHWKDLIKNCELKKLCPKLIDHQIITEQEIKQEFSFPDERHNKRLLFFWLMEQPKSFLGLIDALRDSGQVKLADELAQGYKPHKTTQFRLPIVDEGLEMPKSPIVKSFNTLVLRDIEVKPSTQFYDTFEHNGILEYYSTRSRRKGQVLILNNYAFYNSDHEYRTGATVDERNLEELFRKMGFGVSLHSNKTADEMKMLIQDFVRYEENKESDMCFVIIMSHGNELGGDTVVLGNDNHIIKASWIEEQFNNQNCKLFRGKPKVILYQVCRGPLLDLSLISNSNTQTDSATTPTSERPPKMYFKESIRTIEDMLIGHSTLQGYKAHRDILSGTWYIQLICEIFMESAHNTPVDSLLSMVDQKLRRRMSENSTMQTSEISNRGFKRCFIHPGIYEEDGELKHY